MRNRTFHACLLGIAAAFGLSASVAHATLLSFSCGALIQSIVKTENVASATSSVGFVVLAGAVTTVVVPARTTRCIKVVFTASAACRGPSAVSDTCIIRALDNGAEFSPQGSSVQTFVSEDPTQNAHAFEWIRRVGPGNHGIVIQRRVFNAASSFLLDDWTFDVQVLN